MFATHFRPRLLARTTALLRARVPPQPPSVAQKTRRDGLAHRPTPRPIAALNTTSAPWLLHPPTMSLSHGLDEWHVEANKMRGFVTRNESEHVNDVQAVSNWNAANAVTLGRIVAAPVLAHCIVAESYDAALAVLLYAGASDWLDGLLARRFALHTTLGSYMDPLADKLLVSCATLSLAYNAVLPPWLALLIVSRDAAIVAGGAVLLFPRVARARGAGAARHSLVDLLSTARRIEPLFVSKVNTALQISLAVTAVASASDWNLVSADAVAVIGNATAVTTVASGTMYARAFFSLK